MAVSYKRLWIKLAEKEMSRADLRKKAEIAPNTMTKLGKDEYVAMPILDKICKKLGTDYGEIMEYVPDKEGKMLSSEELAGKIQKLGVEGKGHLVFVIGGSLGLSKEVMDRADYALSFSKMTFPHQLMRVILLAQIYRGFKIIAGEPYHK